MKIKCLVPLLAAIFIVLLIGALVLYWVIEDDNEVYTREVTFEVKLDDEFNSTGGYYTVVFPLPVREKDGMHLIEQVDEIQVVLGRCNLSFMEEEDFFGLRIVSDTEILLKYYHQREGDDLKRDRILAALSSMSGETETNSASIEIFSNRTGLDVKETFTQRIESSGGLHNYESLECVASLNEGWSRYPLTKVIPVVEE